MLESASHPAAFQDLSPARQLIARTWAEMMPFIPMDETVVWRESGVDSLATLQFFVRLEQVLERPVGFDMLAPEMTVGEIITAIEQQDPAATTRAQQPVRLDLVLFIVPGLMGDGPSLADFRRGLVGQVHFHTLVLPNVDSPASLISSIPRTAETLVRQINERQPSGPIYLCGYSIGGMIAHDTANLLLKAGRDVRLLGLLDSFLKGDFAGLSRVSRLPGPPDEPPGLLTIFKRRGREDMATYAERLAYGLIMRLGLYEWGRRWILRFAHRHDYETNWGRRWRLIQAVRGRSIPLWRPRPCAAPALLITSDEFEAFFSAAPWRRLCPNLKVARVGGRHLELFNPPTLGAVVTALADAMEVEAARSELAAS
jgi:thioesterase domain-containing protein/acyl carrier protein